MAKRVSLRLAITGRLGKETQNLLRIQGPMSGEWLTNAWKSRSGSVLDCSEYALALYRDNQRQKREAQEARI